MSNQKTSKKKEIDLYTDYATKENLKSLLCENLEAILDDLEVDYRFNSKMYVGCCPVHGGDNETAFNLYQCDEEDESMGYWVCRTHHCEKKRGHDGKLLYGANIIGLIKGILSNRLGRTARFKETIDYAVKFLGYESLSQISKHQTKSIERRKYASSMKRLSLKPKQETSGWSREELRSKIEVPCKYYIDRGYSPTVLDKYDVGLYNKLNRVVVPVYDDGYKYVAGFLGRSIFPQCSKCNRWHDEQHKCPDTSKGMNMKHTSKWINGSFKSSNYLYNYWFALKNIQKTSTAILVEGAGDVWRLEENGVHIGLGLFGTEMTDAQRVLLDRSGALSIIVLLDADTAGQEGIAKLKSQLGRQYRMFFPKIKDDVGSLNSDEITSDIKPIIDKVRI